MKEHDIRPQKLLDTYLELLAKDAQTCFIGFPRETLACVACAERNDVHQFKKNGFSYALCSTCGTLYQNPRPAIDAFENFYRQSESSRFWAQVFFPAVAEIRREKIIRRLVTQLSGLLSERQIPVKSLIDVGAGYGLFLEEWAAAFPNTQSIAIEPSSALTKECKKKGFYVIEDMVENVKGHNNFADLITCFEVFEHVYNPVEFLTALKNLTKPGGYIFISTLGIDGFDLQVLWEKSTQISPPHHINFLSMAGFKYAFQRAGLENISITTPGQLDVDIVFNSIKRDPSILEKNQFISNLLKEKSTASAFQDFLVEQKLSSHVWIIGQKPF